MLTPLFDPKWSPTFAGGDGHGSSVRRFLGLRRAGRTMRRRRSWRLVVACLVALAMTVVDQGTKALALAQLSEQERIPLIGDLLGLQLAFNPGTVMSLGSSSTWVFTLVGIVAVIALFYAAWRAPSTMWAVAIGFVWGGAIGNLIDRLFAPPGFGRGHVTDFLAYGNLFIGNIADIAIGVGVGLGILQMLRSHRSQPRSEHPAATPTHEK